LSALTVGNHQFAHYGKCETVFSTPAPDFLN